MVKRCAADKMDGSRRPAAAAAAAGSRSAAAPAMRGPRPPPRRSRRRTATHRSHALQYLGARTQKSFNNGVNYGFIKRTFRDGGYVFIRYEDGDGEEMESRCAELCPDQPYHLFPDWYPSASVEAENDAEDTPDTIQLWDAKDFLLRHSYENKNNPGKNAPYPFEIARFPAGQAWLDIEIYSTGDHVLDILNLTDTQNTFDYYETEAPPEEELEHGRFSRRKFTRAYLSKSPRFAWLNKLKDLVMVNYTLICSVNVGYRHHLALIRTR